MDAALGRQTDALNFFRALAESPFSYDFYQTMRRLECLYAEKPRWGSALRPIDEPVRLGQDPDLSFAPAPLSSFSLGENGTRPRLQVRLFGLLGPNGPLPIHITEYVRERLIHAGDPTLTRFLDLFHHRFLALFYRAWAQAQPHVNHDRPQDDRFTIYIGAFTGTARPALRQRDSVPDLAKLFHVGSIIRQVRNAEGLASILRHFFGVPVGIEEFVGHWMRLADSERTQLGRSSATLGERVVIGRGVWDHQSKFRIHLGPLTLTQYQALLPGGRLIRKLVDWVRFYLCFELDWDVRLQLAANEIPPMALGRSGQLGWTTWLGQRKGSSDADDLCLDAEQHVTRNREAA